MLHLILFILFISASLYGFSIITSFEFMSMGELKRQAHNPSSDAARVYPVRTYGIELWFLLRFFQGIFLSVSFLELYFLSNGFWVTIGTIIFFMYVTARRPQKNLHRAAQVSVVIERLLIIAHPVFRSVASYLGRNIEIEKPIMFESKEALIEILRNNEENSKTVSKDVIEIAINSLQFGEKLVGDTMTPLAAVHFVKENELLSPVVLSELHDSGFSRFPVCKGTNQTIIGTLYIKDALKLKKPQPASEVMRHEVFYCNEMQNLDTALKAFLKVKHHMFIVVNEFEDVVGVLSIEDILREIIGSPIMDEFDQHEDLREVAKQLAKAKKIEHQKELV